MADGFLNGVRILDLASVGPAARASRWLADYGATVIKIGPTGASGASQVAPPYHSYSGQRGTKRLLLDLKSAQGVEVFLRLAVESDIVIESFRPGVVDRLRIGYDAVRAVNPRIIYCSTSGYGQEGPHQNWAGHDLNYLSAGGFFDAAGRDERGGPPLPGTTIADIAAGGMHAVMAIQAALIGRQQTGAGAYLDVSVVDGLLAMMSMQLDAYLATGAETGPGHGLLHGQYACYGTYRSRDGKWLSVAAIESKFWANLCRELGLERWIASQMDDSVQEEIRADMAGVFETRDRDDWVAQLGPSNTCVAPVLTVAEVVDSPHVTERNLVGEVSHPVQGQFRQLAPTLAGAQRPTGVVSLPDPNATDTDELLAGAGMSSAEITQLREKGIIA